MGFTAENLLEKTLYRVEGMKGNDHRTQQKREKRGRCKGKEGGKANSRKEKK